MFIKLPKEHPPVKGCVNLKTIKEVMALDFEDWEMRSDGMMILVNLHVEFHDEDWDFVSRLGETLSYLKHNIPPASSYLPIRMQEWFNESELKGEWFYDVRSTTNGGQKSRQVYRFFFQYMADAMIFKLRWVGE